MPALQLHLLLKKREKRKAAHQRQFSVRLLRAGMFVNVFISLALIALLSIFSSAFASLAENLPSLEQLPLLLDTKSGILLQPTRFYDRSGQTLLYTLENPGVTRTFLSVDPQTPDHFSPLLIQVLLASHDPTFWQNPGFSLKNLLDLQPATLAEELVDQMLLQNEPPGVRRALRMRLLAAQLVARFGRAQVLEWYLNSAWFGHLAYGAENASQLYLGKSAVNLDLAEATLLISLLDSPALNPLDTPTAAREQHILFLNRLEETRAFDPAQLQEVRSKPLEFQQPDLQAETDVPPIVRLASQQYIDTFSTAALERGGLIIHTTLDADLQNQLQCTLDVQIARLQQQETSLDNCPAGLLLPTLPPTRRQYGNLAAEAMLLDPGMGEVLAWVETGDNQVSPQPGSMLTPFLALAAFSRGYAPASLVWDIPASLSPELETYIQPPSTYQGPVRLRNALANDYLIPQTQILMNIGASATWDIVRPLGLSLQAMPGDQEESILFQGSGVSLLNLSQAYTTFANMGKQRGFAREAVGGALQPAAILKVQDVTGRVVWQESPQETLLVSPALAYLVHDILSDENARQASLGHPNALEIGRPAGAKVGSADGASQVWAVGYTPQRLASVWLATTDENHPESTLETRMAAGIWHAIMQYALRDEPVQTFPMPYGVTRVRVCNPSGLLPTAVCPLVVDEVFLAGSEPTTHDTLYQVFPINIETGALATVFTPLELVQERTFMVVPPEAQEWAVQAGIALPPTGYDQIEIPTPLPYVSIRQPQPFAYLSGVVDLQGSAAGENFSAYTLQAGEGLNPSAWLQIGASHSQPVEYGLLETWDTRTLPDGPYALRLQVVNRDNTLNSMVTLYVIDNTPPEINLLFPQPGDTFSLSSQPLIIFRASVTDNFGIQQVHWFVDGVKVHTVTQEPYSFPWDAIPGNHLLSAQAVDLAGNTALSQEILIHITP